MSKLPEDPSGIVVHDSTVYVVGNKSNQEYSRFSVDGLPDTEGVVKLKNLTNLGRVKLDHDRADDLESIDVLEGSMVVLSEDSRRIIHTEHTLVDYSDLPSFRESGGRGLEGMSVRRLPDGSSQIAVVWEGGIHKDNNSVNRPRLLVHQVGDGALGAKLHLRPTTWETRINKVTIDESLGDTRFRIPDLVWSWLTDKETWGFVLLLSHHGGGKKDQKYLQTFDTDGSPVGDPRNLVDLGMPSDVIESNWEGLCWHTDSNGIDHLLLVNDTGNDDKKCVCRIRPPADCLRQPEAVST